MPGLDALTSSVRHTVGMSAEIILGGRAMVTEGPLKGCEENSVKNYHAFIANLDVHL